MEWQWADNRTFSRFPEKQSVFSIPCLKVEPPLFVHQTKYSTYLQCPLINHQEAPLKGFIRTPRSNRGDRFIVSGNVCEHFGSSTLFMDTTLEPAATLLLIVHQCISYYNYTTGYCIIVNVNILRRDALRFLFERTLASVSCHKVMLGNYCGKPSRTSRDAEIELVSLQDVEKVGVENYPENVSSDNRHREKLTWRASPLEMPIRLVLGSVVVWCGVCAQEYRRFWTAHMACALETPRGNV